MQCIAYYLSPLGEILLAADEIGLTGLWFAGQKYCARGLDPDHEQGDLPALDAAKRWLKAYFQGNVPAAQVPLHLTGTPFQMAVWEQLQKIPYGETVTYGELAAQLGIKSARAVGSAVGKNPVSLIVPCHRVLGAGGKLTGYAGGLDRKRQLLQMENKNK